MARQGFGEALARALVAGKQPLLLVIDDLPCCDQETVEWVHYLLRFATQARLLIVGTVRPEEVTTDIGRACTVAVLAQASDGDEDALMGALDELWQRRIIREQSEHAYDFSHDEMREAAQAASIEHWLLYSAIPKFHLLCS